MFFYFWLETFANILGFMKMLFKEVIEKTYRIKIQIKNSCNKESSE